MIISIDMAHDLTTAKNPKMILLSPSYKRYELDAYTKTYGSRQAVGKSIPMMSLNAETEGIVEHEEGEFQVMATCEMNNYRLSSDLIKVRLDEKVIASPDEGLGDMKNFQAANYNQPFVSPIGQTL